jgi:hypothetical protein
MVLGAAVILGGVVFRLGWESAVFALVFVAMWHFAANKRLYQVRSGAARR